MNDYIKLTAYVVGSLVMLLAFCFFTRLVRIKHPGYVFTLIYAFSFGLVVSVMFLYWAYHSGAIDEQGSYISNNGRIAKDIVDLLTNINSEIEFVAGIFVLLIVPQLVAYALSGIFGCAKNIFLFRLGGTTALWLIIKAFAFVAGFLIVEGTVGSTFGWKGFSLSILGLTIFLPSAIMAVMMLTLNVYMHIDDAITDITKSNNKILRAIHARASQFSK